MSAISITAGNVAPSTNAGFITGYLAGVAITAGMAVYLDTSNAWQKMDANASAITAGSGLKFGIAVNSAAIGAPLAVQNSGLLTIGGTVAAGEIYVPGATAGEIVPEGDLASGWYVTILAVGFSASQVVLCPQYTGCVV